MNESEETEEIKAFPSTFTYCKDSRPCPAISQYQLHDTFASPHHPTGWCLEHLSENSCWFVCVCVEVLQPSQPNGVMSSAVSLPNHTFTGQAQSSKRLTSIVHILSPETDNCPS